MYGNTFHFFVQEACLICHSGPDDPHQCQLPFQPSIPHNWYVQVQVCYVTLMLDNSPFFVLLVF